MPHPTRRRALVGLACLPALGLRTAAAQGTQSPSTKAPADQLDLIMRHRVLRVAVPQNFPPFGFVNAKGALDGFDIAMARMLATDLRVALETHPMASAERIPALLEDRVDIVISSLGRTPERERQIDFTSAYAPTYNGIFGTGDAPLQKRRIGVVRGSLEEADLKAQVPQAVTVPFDSSGPLLEAYTRRAIDAFAAGNVVVESIPDGTLRERTQRLGVLRQSPCHIGVRKHEPRLLARVEAFLSQAKASQALMVNAIQWFKHSLSPDMFRDAH